MDTIVVANGTRLTYCVFRSVNLLIVPLTKSVVGQICGWPNLPFENICKLQAGDTWKVLSTFRTNDRPGMGFTDPIKQAVFPESREGAQLQWR